MYWYMDRIVSTKELNGTYFLFRFGDWLETIIIVCFQLIPTLYLYNDAIYAVCMHVYADLDPFVSSAIYTSLNFNCHSLAHPNLTLF